MRRLCSGWYGPCRPIRTWEYSRPLRKLIGATTFFGRLQQFAACVYGPVITRGLSAWSGDSGNYWGHNAIIRMAAFAQNCGLPKLAGRKPFGGFVLSHDFVEAALMRRGGLEGAHGHGLRRLLGGISAIADRRSPFATGAGLRATLQHMKVIGTAGFSLISRMHLGVGIMSYLSSPLWLVMLAIGFALSRAVALDSSRVFQSRLSAVSHLAAFRCRTDDGPVLVQHGRAADSEDARSGSQRCCRGASAGAAAA